MKPAILSVALLLSAIAWSPHASAEASFSFFYSNLTPHGSWFVSGQYGRVWQPDVYVSGWNPYYDGHWAYTDLGWIWVSDYTWGAIPYHYGTWVDDPALGWIWVPGYVWAPAWVVFRTGPEYIGWAPVSPGFSVGLSAELGESVAGPFVFVSAGDFLAPRVRGCIVPESRATVIIKNTRIVNNLRVENNIVVNRGPDASFVERASGHRLRAVPVEQVPRAGPGTRLRRDQLRVDSRRLKEGLRAAEPTVERRPSGTFARNLQDETRGEIANRGPAARPPFNQKTMSERRDLLRRVSAPTGSERRARAPDRVPFAIGSAGVHRRGTSLDRIAHDGRLAQWEPSDDRVDRSSREQRGDRLIRNQQPARERGKTAQRSNKKKGS